MSAVAKLYKLAYALDKKGMYSEAKEIEKVMETMAKRVGLHIEDMVSIADYFDQAGEFVLADKFDKMAIEKRAAEKTKPRPPKKWWNKMVKEIKDGSPDYSEERVNETVGDIWYNNLTDKKRKEIINRDGTKEKKKEEKKKGRI